MDKWEKEIYNEPEMDDKEDCNLTITDEDWDNCVTQMEDRLKKIDEALDEVCISEQEEMAFDMVNKPRHYNSGNIEPIDYIEDVTRQLTDGFEGACIANVIKYISRQHLKNGLVDVKKARWYLNRLIEYMEKNDVESL
jgi:hypothetical protein